MRIKYLDWDNENVDHISRHNVNEKEVKEVCRGRFWFRRARDERYILFGQTYSGRYLFVVVQSTGKGVFRPITARDMTSGERRFYRKKVK